MLVPHVPALREQPLGWVERDEPRLLCLLLSARGARRPRGGSPRRGGRPGHRPLPGRPQARSKAVK